jgi:hypothetical protein
MADDRIRDDDSLVPPGGEMPGFFEEPAIVVHKVEGGKVGFAICTAVFDERMDTPAVYGIIISDLIDHLAASYASTTGRDAKDVRAQLHKVVRDEERFKEKDPARGRGRGATIFPKRN